MELREQLQQTLGGAYTIERELGGGGMSRVFLAEEQSEARQVLARLHEYEQREYVWRVTTALTYAHLGEMGAAFQYLRQCVDDRAAWIQLPYAPTFDVFRDDPRFDALTHEIGATAPPGWRWPVSN